MAKPGMLRSGRAERLTARREEARAKVVGAANARYTNGPAIEEPLLTDLRSARAELETARAAIEEHNLQARALTDRASDARAVWLHYEKRAKDVLGLKDGDLLALQEGVVRVRVEAETGKDV